MLLQQLAAADPSAPVTWTELLYDVAADPFDMNNLAGSMPAVVKAMKTLLPPGWCGA